MNKLSDEQLVKAYKQGEETAFNEIYSRYSGLVKYFCRNLFLLGAENEDLMQEGMFGLINAVNKYKDGNASFLTFATTCIKNSLISAVKKYSNSSSNALNNCVPPEILDSMQIFDTTPEDIVLSRESGGELKHKIYGVLSKNEIIVLNLFLEGLSYIEIALKTGKNVKSVNNALTRARKKIIKCIGE